jgi:hypothetical protein
MVFLKIVYFFHLLAEGVTMEDGLKAGCSKKAGPTRHETPAFLL